MRDLRIGQSRCMMGKFFFGVPFPTEKSTDPTFWKNGKSAQIPRYAKKKFWLKHYRVESHKKYNFQQDGATPHTANTVQEWL